MEDPKHINLALAAIGRADTTVAEADTGDAYDVFFNGDATPLTITDDGFNFELSREVAPKHYRYAGSARSFTGIAREITSEIADLIKAGVLTPTETT